MIHSLQTLLLMIFPALVIAAAVSDLTSYTIPNKISLALVAGFPIAALALGLPPMAIAVGFGIGAAALVVSMGMFAAGWIGGGDAKLFAAAALWLGLPSLLTYLVITCVAGGALAIGLVGLRSGPVRAVLPAGPAWFVRLAEPGENVPYGVAIAIGALAAYPASTLVAHL